MSYTIMRSGMIRRDADAAFIPADPANADFREYLAWKEAGNAADVEPAPTLPPIGSVPAWAAKAALDEAGLLAQVETLTQGAGLAWKYRFLGATEWRRATVLELAPQMNPPLSEAQVDALLTRAAAIANS